MTAPKAILTDTTLCIGCEKCITACKKENDLGDDVARRWKIRIDDLSSTRFTTLVRRTGSRFIRRHCRHCLEPACVSACIVGALQKAPEGPVIYDSDKCMGCRYCMMACPYGIPRYDWESSVPYIRKCSMCYERIKQGGIPACVEACDRKATIFGSRDELLAEAHRRIKERPSRYIDRVFGETEVGGTSVLYISDIALGFLGNQTGLGDKPLPELTWEALSKVPPIVLGTSALMAGVWLITDRRMKLKAETKKADAVDNTEERSGSDDLPQSNPGDEEE